jgi:hypothetical protein
MGDHAGVRRVVVVTSDWEGTDPEAAFVVRSLAGAISRHATVDIVTPGRPGTRADGLFDVRAVGTGTELGRWPPPVGAVWPDLGGEPGTALVDAADAAALHLVRHHLPDVRVLAMSADGTAPGGATAVLTLRPSVAAAAPRSPGCAPGAVSGTSPGPAAVVAIDVHVPVNPLAAARPHNGLGFTGYLLVLTDRAGRPEDSPPTPAVRWLTARFPREQIVVVEGARALVWQGRSLRGVVGVDTRTDLWRLVAHAAALVDLSPGDLIARECIESLRFGTPVIVPAGTVAAELAATTGGGLWFADMAELFGCVEAVGDAGTHQGLGEQGRAVADGRHGDPARTVEQVGRLLAG